MPLVAGWCANTCLCADDATDYLRSPVFYLDETACRMIFCTIGLVLEVSTRVDYRRWKNLGLESVKLGPPGRSRYTLAHREEQSCKSLQNYSPGSQNTALPRRSRMRHNESLPPARASPSTVTVCCRAEWGGCPSLDAGHRRVARNSSHPRLPIPPSPSESLWYICTGRSFYLDRRARLEVQNGRGEGGGIGK